MNERTLKILQICDTFSIPFRKNLPEARISNWWRLCRIFILLCWMTKMSVSVSTISVIGFKYIYYNTHKSRLWQNVVLECILNMKFFYFFVFKFVRISKAINNESFFFSSLFGKILDIFVGEIVRSYKSRICDKW